MTEKATLGIIFLNDRREDSEGSAGRLYGMLLNYYEPHHVFRDIDNIEPGDDFVERIEQAVGSCSVMLALVGKQWATLSDSEGKRRIDNPYDFVRLEIETALHRNILVLPVLAGGASMPQMESLPGDLIKFSHLNAVRLTYDRFREDVEQLVMIAQRHVLSKIEGSIKIHFDNKASTDAVPPLLFLQEVYYKNVANAKQN